MFNLNIYFYKLSLAMVFKDHRILMLLLAESWVEILNQLEPREGECFNESVLIISLKQNLFKRLCVNKTQS